MLRSRDWVILWVLSGGVAVAVAAPPSTEEMATTVTALKSRLKDATNRLAELEDRLARQDTSLAKLAKEMAADAATQSAGPTWMENLKFYGDLRLRYQNDCKHGEGRSRRPKMRNRARFRLRFGIKKTWLDDQFEVGFRIASGEPEDEQDGHFPDESDPTSTNQTFTNYFSEKRVWIDRAYAKYKPKAIKGLTFIGGKMGTPMVHTDLVWDSDVNPEGFWGEYKKAFGPIEPFVSTGYFVVDESSSGDDVTLAAYQVGMNWEIAKDVKWTFAATYYDYDETNEMVGEYQMINLTNKVGFKAFGLPWSVYVDFVHNCRNETVGEYEDEDDGIALGVKLGRNKKKGDWSVGYKYAYIEQYCTPRLFNDSDFGRTNTKGHCIGAKYNVTDFLTLGGKVFLLDGIAGSSYDEHENVLTQIDLVWKF